MSGLGRYAARRARNRAWLHVYDGLWLDFMFTVPEKPLRSDGDLARLTRSNEKRNSRAAAPNTYHTLFKLAGLARVCARRGTK